MHTHACRRPIALSRRLPCARGILPAAGQAATEVHTMRALLHNRPPNSETNCWEGRKCEIKSDINKHTQLSVASYRGRKGPASPSFPTASGAAVKIWTRATMRVISAVLLVGGGWCWFVSVCRLPPLPGAETCPFMCISLTCRLCWVARMPPAPTT
jgi:hypothetical protein